MYKLTAMNEGYSVLANLGFAPGVHPWEAYLELTRIVGKLAVLGNLTTTGIEVFGGPLESRWDPLNLNGV